jgi:hypothetical protein
MTSLYVGRGPRISQPVRGDVSESLAAFKEVENLVTSMTSHCRPPATRYF